MERQIKVVKVNNGILLIVELEDGFFIPMEEVPDLTADMMKIWEESQ